MMASIDFFCAADDRHRVILLVDLLEKAGQAVVLRTEPVALPTRPCLVACTRRAFREAWLRDLFSRANQVVALRLDDAPLPGPAAPIIELQAWPARSADRQVGALVDWLVRGAGGSAGAPARTGPLALARRIRLRLADPSLTGAVALLGLVAAMVLLLLMLGRSEPAPTAAGDAATRPNVGHVVPIGSGTAGERLTGMDGGAVSGSAAARAALAAGALEHHATPAEPPMAAGPPNHLRQLCEPRTLAAAKAWSGVLYWLPAAVPFDQACRADPDLS